MRMDMTADKVIDAFKMAVMRRKPQRQLLFHSDRGVQYCSSAFSEAAMVLHPKPVRSMSRRGNCWDNVCAESFFKTLKSEVEELGGRTS